MIAPSASIWVVVIMAFVMIASSGAQMPPDLSSVTPFASSGSSDEFYGVRRPSDMSEADWRHATELFTEEMERYYSGTGLLRSRDAAGVVDLGVPCQTENNAGLKCVDEPTNANVNAARDCIFLHGSGEKADGPVTNTYPGYWGNVDQFTKQCKSRTFIHANTLTRDWYNYTLVKKYCDIASGGQGGGRVIANKLIWTHSMGGLVLGAALYEGVCSLDSSSSWYQVGAPQTGSRAADWAVKICANPSGFAAPIRWIASYMGYCSSPNPGPANQAYLSMITTNPNITARHIVPVIAKSIKGALCGISGVGLVAPTSIPMEALALLTCKEKCDGMVEIGSCAPLGANWGTNSASSFYQAGINHADETCRNGNGVAGDSRKPCDWYGLRQ